MSDQKAHELLLNLSGWIEFRADDIGPYADHIIHSVKHYEAEIERLRADLAAPKIEPLVWKSGYDHVFASAYGIDRAYLISGEPGDWTLRYVGNRQEETLEGFETQVAAKKAAQKLHNPKVLSALEGGDP